MNWMQRRRLRKLKAELATLEARYRNVTNAPGETTRMVPAAMRQWGPRIAELKHDIKELEDDHAGDSDGDDSFGLCKPADRR